MRFLFLTMDGNHAGALCAAAAQLRQQHGLPLELGLYDATKLRTDADWQRLAADIASADFIFGSMLFGEELVRPLVGLLTDATCPVCVITSNPTLIRLTRLGKLSLAKREDDGREPNLLQQWAKKLRPNKGGHGEGKRQLAMLRNIGKLMKFIPGKARDLHTYIAVHQYWMHGSPENLARMLCMFAARYTQGWEKLPIHDPIEYPEVALFHPDADAPFSDLAGYQKWQKRRQRQTAGTVGLLSLRTVALSRNTAHLDGLVRALERRGLAVRMAYGAGLDFRPAMERFFGGKGGQSDVDVLLNGAGFSLIGGMAESRPAEARATLEQFDVSYHDMIPLSFQNVEDWQRDDTGLSPIQVAMNVAVPELDAATEPWVFGGPSAGGEQFVALEGQIEHAAERIARRVALRRTPNHDKRIVVVLFNFPPNLGNVGTAAYLDVFASLHRLLSRMREDGYNVALPPTVDDLREALVAGNSAMYGTDGNVGARLSVADYRRMFPDYADIEPFWGAAPGELLNDGQQFYILGAQFGNVFVGLQPSFGYERDPMRLLMAKDAAPNHGFAAFYTWLDRVFGAHAVVHFGTHGALEFMPGKQVGMTAQCWPARLLGGLPNLYYYSVNNPSEATIAKRRGAATTISYMVPPLQQAGLYKGLRVLKDALDTYQRHPSPELLDDIRVQAERLGIRPQTTDDHSASTYLAELAHELIAVEQRMIPLGLHVLGQMPAETTLLDTLTLVATFHAPAPGVAPLPELVAAGLGYSYTATRDALSSDRNAQARWEQIAATVREAVKRLLADGSTSADTWLRETATIRPGTVTPLWDRMTDLAERMQDERELHGLMHGLEGGYIPPSPGNDVVRNPAIVPTGRNIHGLDPYRVPTVMARRAGAELAQALLERLTADQGQTPETVAMVLWGTDNLKSDCEGVAQALALMGADVVEDEMGNVADVRLIPLAELSRPRIDVVVTVSGIFRDLLIHQMQLLDKAARAAADADEPVEFNFIRKHALAQAANAGTSAGEAATRIFSNAPGSYGANVNHLVESGNWESDDELGEAFLMRKSFAYGAGGGWRQARGDMEQALATVDATFQNVDSFELGVSDVDHYYEYLGGVTKSVEKLRGARPQVLVAEAMATSDRIMSLERMVRLETRAKLLNPAWFESMLAHGYQGVREIETRVANTYGWSATANAVEGWVYQGVADTFLLDDAMRERLATLNPHATAAMTRRLLEANGRGFWDADEQTIQALQELYGDLEDRMEGVHSAELGR